jgi:hypothetical protein
MRRNLSQWAQVSAWKQQIWAGMGYAYDWAPMHGASGNMEGLDHAKETEE